LLEKISELSKQLSGRGEELREVKSELNRLENVNESLLHQLYLLEKKEANKKTTQQFYDLKRQKATTPTARNW
jgi:gas vesicle protein